MKDDVALHGENDINASSDEHLQAEPVHHDEDATTSHPIALPVIPFFL
jgi:hypothetical protein